jgi:hypothetical protein
VVVVVVVDFSVAGARVVDRVGCFVVVVVVVVVVR